MRKTRTSALPLPKPQLFDYSFDNEGRTLVLTADIAKGWRKEKRSGEVGKTFFFMEVREIDWQGGAIRAHLALFPRPSGLSEQWENPPDFEIEPHRKTRMLYLPELATDGQSEYRYLPDCFVAEMSKQVLRVTVDLLGEDRKPWLGMPVRAIRSGQTMVKVLDDHHWVPNRPFSIWVQLRLFFKPPIKPAPIDRSFWNDFLPGGRPESNRRKF